MNPSLNSSALYSLRFGFSQHHFCWSQTRLVTCSDQKRHDVDHSFGFCPSVRSDWLNSICALIGCDRCGQMKCVRLIVQNGADWIQVCISRSTATDLVTCMTSHFFLSFFSFFPYRLPLYQSSLMSVVIMPSAILLWFSCVWALFRPWAQHLPSALRFPSHAPPPLEQQPITRRLRSPLRICSSCKNRDAVLIREADNPFDRYFNRYSPITGNSSVAVRSKFIFKGVSSTMDTEKLNFIQTRRQDHWRIIHSVVEITF